MRRVRGRKKHRMQTQTHCEGGQELQVLSVNQLLGGGHLSLCARGASETVQQNKCKATNTNNNTLIRIIIEMHRKEVD